MGQKDFTKDGGSGISSLLANNELSIHDDHESAGIHDEFFIRKAFDSNPRLGCELLFRQYYQPLCSHATRFISSKALAEDLVSDIFCQFYAQQTFKEITTSYRAYLYKAVRYRAYNYVRWELKRNTDLTAADHFSINDAQQPDAITHYEDLYNDVENAINDLPPQCRKIYLMHRFENKKHQEIATLLSLAPKTIEVQIRRASHIVRNKLKHKWSVIFIGIIGFLLFK